MSAMSVDERLGRIETKLDTLVDSMVETRIDVSELKKFRYQITGAIGVIVPIYTLIVMKLFGA